MVIVNETAGEEKIVLDSGFNFGRGVFETILVTDQPLFLTQHLERLNRGLIAIKVSKHITEQYVLDIVKQHSISNCVMKIAVTEKNTVISTRPSAYRPEQYERGFEVKLSSLRRNPFSHTTYIKSLNYTDNLLEKEQAAAEGFDEVLFLNCNLELAEGSASNVFAVIDGRIYTPPISCGLLDGIIRAWVLENFDVIEAALPLDALRSAQEVFLTNSVMGIMKVKTIGDIVYKQDSIFKMIRKKYLDDVEHACSAANNLI